MSRRAVAVASVALYLYGSGLTLAFLTHYWEGLPLGPRDGQAFMAGGLLGFAIMLLGILGGALALAVRPGGPVWLLVAVVAAIAAAIAVTYFHLIDLSFLLVVPAAVFIALLLRSPREAALRIAVSGGFAWAAFAAFASSTGPLAWMTKGLDASVVGVWLALAVLSMAAALIGRRIQAAVA